nr:Ste3-9 [Ganoderma boninense]
MAPHWIAQVDAPAALSLAGFVLITIPLFWHLRAWNTGCVLYIFWIGGLCLTNGINMLLWRENAVNFAPAWCDIYVRFYIASSVGVVSTSLVITHRLYHIANMTSAARRRRNVLQLQRTTIDLLIGLGIPLLAVALFWFYQGHRFNILEGVGCVEAYPNTFLSILLNTSWPIPISLTSSVYAFLALRGAFDRTRDLKQLQVVEPDLSTSCYYRLMALAAVNILFTIPLAIYVIATNLSEGLYPYRGFADLHSNFGRVDSTAAIVWREDPTVVSLINFRIWTPIACALFFFLMFGFTAEARTQYLRVLASAARPFGITFFEQRAASEASTLHFRRRSVAESGLWDRDDWASTKSGLATVEDSYEPSTRLAGSSECSRALPLGTTGISAYRVERSSKKGDIVVMAPVTEPPPAYTRSPSPSMRSPMEAA